MVVRELHTEKKAEIVAIELTLARLLRVGSLAAALLLGAGIVLTVTGVPFAPRLVNAGLVVLMATPVLRVLVAGIIFVKERDWHFALFSLVVLCALAIGILLGGE